MSGKLTNFVLRLWAVIGVLVLLGAGAWGISLNHNRRVAKLKDAYDLQSFGVNDFEEKARKYIEEEVAWKHMLDVGAVPDKQLRAAHESNKNLYKDITDKRFDGKSLIEIDKEKQQAAFNAWYEAKNQWW